LFVRELQHESASLNVPNLVWLSCFPESGRAPLAVRAKRNVPFSRAPLKRDFFAPGRHVNDMDLIGGKEGQGQSIKTQARPARRTSEVEALGRTDAKDDALICLLIFEGPPFQAALARSDEASSARLKHHGPRRPLRQERDLFGRLDIPEAHAVAVARSQPSSIGAEGATARAFVRFQIAVQHATFPARGDFPSHELRLLSVGYAADFIVIARTEMPQGGSGYGDELPAGQRVPEAIGAIPTPAGQQVSP